MAVFEDSRYLHTKQYTRLGWDVPLLGLRERFIFNPEECSIYEWVEGDTLDGVSVNFYGNPALRWAILDANPKYKTEFEIKPGDILVIPNYEEVVELVNV